MGFMAKQFIPVAAKPSQYPQHYGQYYQAPKHQYHSRSFVMAPSYLQTFEGYATTTGGQQPDLQSLLVGKLE